MLIVRLLQISINENYFFISAESKVVKFIPENYLNPYLSSKNVLNNLVVLNGYTICHNG